MKRLQYNYMGKTWRPCPTAADGNCFFNSVFGTRNSQDEPFRDKYAKFRRMYWSTFLTYYSGEDLKGALLDLLQKCFIANDKYKNESIKEPDKYQKYLQDITVPDYWVHLEEIPLLAALEDIRIVLFIGDCDTPEVFHPKSELLDTFPFQRKIPRGEEVVICLVDNHFSRLQQYDEKHYPKRGGTGIEGGLYQINISAMVLLNASIKVKNWRLSTEHKNAARFDDVIFESLPSESAILLQAKHKIKGNKKENKEIAYKDLVSVNCKDDFSLPKYFFSYQEIIKNKFNVQNIVICTNIGLNNDAKKYLKEETLNNDSVLHFEGIDNIIYYSFKDCDLPDLKQNILDYCTKYNGGEENIVTDKAINDFLTHLQIFPNYLDEKSLDSVKDRTISKVKLFAHMDSNLIFKEIHGKMLNWLKEKKGRYLTEVEAKGFFCDIISNKYCDDLKLYDISFERTKLPFILRNQKDEGKKQTEGCSKDPKRFSHIIPGKENILNVIKIYQELQLSSEHKTNTLFVDPDESADVQSQTIDAFEIKHYTVLVIVCHKAIEENYLIKVMEILKKYEYKHVILIAEETNNVAEQIKKYYEIKYYEVIIDCVKFADFVEKTQKALIEKKIINFQGSMVSLEELFTPSPNENLNEILDSEMLVKLARNDEIRVGVELKDLDKYYVHRSFNRDGHDISEEDICRPGGMIEKKIILIADPAGMGKTTVLTSLQRSIKINNPHLWLVMLELNSYSKIMEETLDRGNKLSIIKLLNSRRKTRLCSEFEKKLFSTRGRVVLILDGVDEVSPTYTELTNNLLKDTLTETNVANIVITSRRHMCKDLEKLLNLKSFALKPFSVDDQITFLTGYWLNELKIQDDIKKRTQYESYAKALTGKMSMWMGYRTANSFGGIPLHTRMLAEIFQEQANSKKLVSTENNEPKLPNRINLIQLYDMFIERKLEIFVKKLNPTGTALAKEIFEQKCIECRQFHQALALKEIFDSHEPDIFTSYTKIEWPISSEILNEFLLKLGIVQLEEENIIYFIHRTFAEYFVAQCLIGELECEPVNEVFMKFFTEHLMLDKQYATIRAFLDCKLRRVRHTFKHKIISLFKSVDKFIRYDYLNMCVTEGWVAILDIIIKCGVDVNVQIRPGQTMLQMAALFGKLEIARFLVKKAGANVDVEDEHGKTALHTAAQLGNLEIVKFLAKEADADLYIKDKNGKTVLYTAAKLDQLEIVKFLVNEASANVDVKDENGETMLQTAVSLNQLGMVKFLVKEVRANVHVKDKTGETLLHTAAILGHLELVKFLVKAGINVDVKNRCGETVLHMAASLGQLEKVKFLVNEAGANVNVKDRQGNTALKLAYGHNPELIKFLTEKTGSNSA